MNMLNGFGMGWFSMIAFWVLVAGAVYLLLGWGKREGGRSSREESPLDILKRRYARGEISREEFERVMKEIG